MRHIDLLRDSFGVDISACGHLCSLPDLLCGILPDVQRMPAFFAQLSRCLLWRGAQRHAAIAEVEWVLPLYICALNDNKSHLDGPRLFDAPLAGTCAAVYITPGRRH